MFSVEEVMAAPFKDGGHNTGHRSVKCSVTISYADLDRSPGRASYATFLQGSRHHSQRSWERTCSSPSFSLSPSFGSGLVSSCQQTGPALALIDPLRQGPRATGLPNDLVTLTTLRVSSLSAGPDAMRIGVVFTGTDAVRILSKGVGRDKPQNRVTKSTGVGCLPPAGVGHRREADEKSESRVVWSDATGNARHNADPFGKEGRQG